MNKANSYRAAAIVAGALAGLCSSSFAAESDPEARPVVQVQLRDIGKTVQIVGELGYPLGELLTVRGRWIRPNELVMDRGLFFEVISVNGKPIKSKQGVKFYGRQVKTFAGRNSRGKLAPDDVWDWKFDTGGTDAAPIPDEGDVYEMRGIETGYFDSNTDEIWAAIGTPPQLPSYSTYPFITQFEYIAVKKIRGGR